MNSSYATNNSNVFHVYLHSQPQDLNQVELLQVILAQQQSSITTIRPPMRKKWCSILRQCSESFCQGALEHPGCTWLPQHLNTTPHHVFYFASHIYAVLRVCKFLHTVLYMCAHAFIQHRVVSDLIDLRWIKRLIYLWNDCAGLIIAEIKCLLLYTHFPCFCLCEALQVVLC